MQPPLLDMRNVNKVYGSRLFQRAVPAPALANFSLELSSDEPKIIALAGESGSGKTTAGLLMLGFLTPTTGEILYDGTSLARMSRAQARSFRREVQAITQDPFAAYNPFYKVDHVFNVLLRKFDIASSHTQARAMIEEALEFVGLRPAETLGRYPHELSGGQRQRIMIARAFLLKPRLLVADEPVSMVDASLRSMILEIVVRLNKELNVSFVYITHDLSTAYEVSDEIIILYRGEVVERGATRAVIDDPQHAYTQLLLRSIPQPDPDARWEGSIKTERLALAE
jgi:peptide/nickel transport system ATP-binding protein